jgi:excisionase family DNA binding protein
MASYVMEVIGTDRNEDAFMSLSETARLLNVSERTIHRWIQDGRLPFYKPGRAYRFRMSDIEAFLEERRGIPLAEREPLDPGIEVGGTFFVPVEEDEEQTVEFHYVRLFEGGEPILKAMRKATPDEEAAMRQELEKAGRTRE